MKRAFYILLLSVLIISFSFKADEGLKTGNDAMNEKIVSSFEVQSFMISKDGLVSWTAINEHGSLPYIVEQFIFDKWVKVGEVNNKTAPEDKLKENKKGKIYIRLSNYLVNKGIQDSVFNK